MAFGFDEYGKIRNLSSRNRLKENQINWYDSDEISDFESPESDIQDTERELIISFYIPGIKKEDITLNIGKDRIELGFDKDRGMKKKEEDYYFAEKIHSQFYTCIYLSSKIIPEMSEVRHESGFLTIYAPKEETDFEEL